MLDYVYAAIYSFMAKRHFYYLEQFQICIETRKETVEKPYFLAGGEYEVALCRGTSRCFKVLSSDSDLLKAQFLWVE